MSSFDTDIEAGNRFEFGKNWARYLRVMNESRIAAAEESLIRMLGTGSIEGKTFLDIGSGSGLFSCAATRLGARRVHSFDYDPQSVACTHELKRRWCPEASQWVIERGSVLDEEYLQRLGQWDIVYSWGVLHHTGHMWTALENAAKCVSENGILYVSIYNDQGVISKCWRSVKWLYNRSVLMKLAVSAIFIPYFVLAGIAGDVTSGKNPFSRYRSQGKRRGMSPVYDWFDWLGGYPFEVAKPEEILHFYRSLGFHLERLTTCGGRMGCNEFVLRRS